VTSRVLLDASQLSGQSAGSGIGTYVRELLAALSERDDVEVEAMATADADLPEGVNRRPITRVFRDGRPAVWEHESRRSWEIRARRGAVFHNPNPHAPLFPGGRWVQTLHDVIPLVYDDPVLSAVKKRFQRYGPRYRHADAVIAVSRHAASEGIRLLDLDPSRIEVIPHGVGTEFKPSPEGPAEPPYISVAGEYARRKGFDAAFAAIGAIAGDGYPHRLVVAGRVQAWLRDEFERLLASAPRRDRVEVMGFVPDLASVYQGATVHLVTSRYEGFGFPALEAMACGVPVVAFANTSIPEVVGDAGILVPDGDVAAMVKAVEGLLDDPAHRAHLSAAGLARAAGYTWDASAAAHAAVYARVANRL
jgi:glycosyltransferase involved in cell wall biosynthesis